VVWGFGLSVEGFKLKGSRLRVNGLGFGFYGF
jgi:hypothetical protein